MSGWWQRFRPPPLLPVAKTTIKIIAAYQLFANCVAELRCCYGSSMLPTISHDGDWVLVSPLPYFRPWAKTISPSRGDLVFASSPRDPRNTVCKRVIGVEGDIVEVEPRHGAVLRKWNQREYGLGTSNEVDEEEEVDTRDATTRYDDQPIRSVKRGEGQFIKVPKGHVWLVGDNLSNSTDSRTYGPVPVALILGKVMARAWPRPRWFDNDVREVIMRDP